MVIVAGVKSVRLCGTSSEWMIRVGERNVETTNSRPKLMFSREEFWGLHYSLSFPRTSVGKDVFNYSNTQVGNYSYNLKITTPH